MNRFVVLFCAILGSLFHAAAATTTKPDPVAAFVTAFVMVDGSGKEVHRFKRGINDDYVVRDTVAFDTIGTRNVSIKVETSGTIHFVKFFFNNKVFPSRDVPFAMQGRGATAGSFATVPYLATAGHKSIRATLFDQYERQIGSFKLRFIMAESGGSSPVAPAPVAAPVAKPVAAPVAKPVAVPVAAPVAKPVVVPVAAPVAKPVAAPVAKPVSVPAPVSPSGSSDARVTALIMVDANGKELHRFVRGIDADFTVTRDTVKFSDIGTKAVSIKVETVGKINHVRFLFNNKVFPSREVPYAMQGSNGNSFPTVPYLATAGDKSLRAVVYGDNDVVIGSTKLRFIMAA
jgi:hypothetical protein